MTHRGNITVKSVEYEYDEIFEAYNVGDDIKTFDKILRDYYISSGYFVFLDSFFWRELFKYLFLAILIWCHFFQMILICLFLLIKLK